MIVDFHIQVIIVTQALVKLVQHRLNVVLMRSDPRSRPSGHRCFDRPHLLLCNIFYLSFSMLALFGFAAAANEGF